MGIKKVKINPLPSITWHWTGMNDSELEIDIPDAAPVYSLRGQTEGLRWTDGIDSETRRRDEVLLWPGWEQMETGMGSEFADALRSTHSALLDIPEAYKAADPTVVNTVARNGRAAGQLLIRSGAGSDATVVIAISGVEETDCDFDTAAFQILIHAEKNANLRLIIVQNLPLQGLSCLNLGGVCAERSEVALTHLSLGAEKTCIGIAMELSGDESAFKGDIGYRVRSCQSVDINYVTRHFGGQSVSGMNAWGVLEDGSSKLFRGTIDFHEGCTGSVGAEKEDVLLLGKNQINKTIPLILCHEEDVEGDHGATISRLDDQVLFYLESRGLRAEFAENMIARARLEALCGRIPDPEIRSETEKMIGFQQDPLFGSCAGADGRIGEEESIQ